MSNDVNRCGFIGRLGADPETRYTQGGSAVTNIRIAVGSSWRDKATGDKKESTEWVPIVFFGKLAEIAQQYLAKGARIYVSGRFRTRKWQDQSGNDRYTTEIVAEQMQMLDGKRDGEGAPRGMGEPSRQGGSGSPAVGGGAADFDDDIPF